MLNILSATIVILSLQISPLTSEVRYAVLVPKVPGSSAQYFDGRSYSSGQGYNSGSGSGQGYNPGISGGQGFNPGVTGGQGYNPGYQGGDNGVGSGSGVVAFSARRADYCCRQSSGVRFERSLTNLGGGWDGRQFTAPASGTYSFSWSGLSPDNQHLRLSLIMNGLEMAASWADSAGYQAYIYILKNTIKKR